MPFDVNPSAPTFLRRRLKKILLFMRLTVFICLVAGLQVAAAGNAQLISLSEKNVPLTQVIRKIQRQVPFNFLYDAELLQRMGNVTVQIDQADISQVMKMCLKDKPLDYSISEKTVIIKPREERYWQATRRVQALIPPQENIKGIVVDENGRPVQGASVVLKIQPTLTGITYAPMAAQTNEKGEFSFPARSGKMTLTISSIGYATVNVAVSASPMRILLHTETVQLAEMIVTGYSTKKVTEVTGSMQAVSGDELRNGVSTANALAMLKGKTAGLYITEGGAKAGSVASRGQVIMRGQASFAVTDNNNYGPLIVLDGVITTAANLQDIVDATDIESITVLRDAASTAIYGSRAAQGVLVVTTRRGAAGKLSVNLAASYGHVESKRSVGFMNTQQLSTHIRRYMQSLYQSTPALQNTYGSFDNYFNTTRTFTDDDLKNDYNWTNDVFYPDGNQQNINLSLTSGSDKTKFYSSINWLKQDGTIIDDRMDRKNIRFNIDQKINDKLSVALNANVIADKYTSTTGEDQAYLFMPWMTPYKADGATADSIAAYSYSATGARRRRWQSNPLYQHQWNTAVTNRQSFLGTGVLKYAVTPWLTLQSTNTYQYIYNNLNSYRDPRTYRGKYNGSADLPVLMNGELIIEDAKTTYYLTSNMASFNKRFGNHQVTALLGQEYGKTHIDYTNLSGYNTPYPGERNLGAFLNYGNGSSSWISVMTGRPLNINSLPSVDKASFSLFSEINDSYNGKYFGSFSFRRDASTNFGRNSRYGNFYAISGAWLMSKEPFMESLKAISQLKLRASYGTSGREAGADFLNFTTYSESTSYAYNSPTTVGAGITRLGNEDITWETTYTTNLGLDLGLWDRVKLAVDFYNRQSKGLLQNTTLPSYQGGMPQVRNVGELRNRGLDILLSATIIQSKDFTWTTDFNISFNSNKLVKLYGDSLIDPSSRAYYRYVGEDLNTIKAITYAGVNPANGRPQFERVMPDKSIVLVDSIPLVKADGLRGYKNVGSATPKFSGGFTTTFRYKAFSLAALFNYVYGNKIYGQALANWMSPTPWMTGQNIIAPSSYMKFWEGPGDTKANYPDFYDPAWAARGATNIGSSLIYQNGSYLRLRNIRLAYELPASLLGKARIRTANIYLSADNVFVVKSPELYAQDPEGATIGAAGGLFSGVGVNSGIPRRFIVGVNVSF